VSWLLLLVLAVQEPDVRAEALARSVAELPRAEAGAWDERWAPDAWGAELRGAYGAALTAYQAGDHVLALHRLQGLLAGHPGGPAALHLYGVTAFRLRRMDDARGAMERFLVHGPQHVGRTRVLGHALYELGEHAAARRHYARVLEVAPDDVEARFGDALSAWRLGAEDEARAAVELVLAARPTHADAAYWAARMAWEADDAGAGAWLELVDRAQALAPRDPRVVYLRSQVLLDLGRGEEAAEARERFERLDHLVRALRALDDQLALAPLDVELLRKRLQVLGALGDTAAVKRARARLIEAQRR